MVRGGTQANMSCVDELQNLLRQQEAVGNARDEMERLRAEGIGAERALDEARASRDRCADEHPLLELVGICSDEQETLDDAQASATGAREAFEEANDAYGEELDWERFAEEVFCECMREDPNPGITIVS
jgi:hypothetical protein